MKAREASTPEVPRKRLDWEGARRKLSPLVKTPELLQQEAAQLLAERATRLSAPLETRAAQDWLELLLFRRGEQRYALESRFLLEVCVCARVSRVPGAGAALVGITNLRGDLVPVFDLAAFDGALGLDSPTNAQLVVLGRRGPDLALLACAVDEVARVASSTLSDPHTVGALRHARYVRGISAEGCQLLDGEAILQDRSSFVARPPNGAHQEREAT